MDAREFYDYIQENFTLDGTASRLVHNILEYVAAENFVDAEDARVHLWSLFDGAFGLTEQEVSQYRAAEDIEKRQDILYGLVDKVYAGDLYYSDVRDAAYELGLTLAEFGDQAPQYHDGAEAYAYWNESGNRHAESAIRVDYNFGENNVADRVINMEIDFVAFGIEPPEPTLAGQECDISLSATPVWLDEGREVRQIRFIDPQNNELFRMSDGGTLAITHPKGEFYPGVQEQWLGICKYVDDNHFEIKGERLNIRHFIEYHQRIGAECAPEPEPEMIGGYRITARTFVGDKIFKRGINPDATQPYATWQSYVDDPKRNDWGHYWSDGGTALKDFGRRIDAERRGVPYDHTSLSEQKTSLTDTLKAGAAKSKADIDAERTPPKSAEAEL